jgi:4-hydroxybenzoate polyprenyltransferase
MGAATAFLIRPRAALVLGRVSNLPTVLSNALAGLTLAGADWTPQALAAAVLALVLFYVGGMYLNDAFDADIDARERPARPIPRGDAARGAVFAAGFALLGLGIAAAFLAGPPAGLAGTALAAAILLYDAVHKRTALAPLIMGLCRLLAYLTAALMAGGGAVTPALLVGALGLFCHVVGLTYAARQEAYDRLGSAWSLAVLAVPLAWALWSALDNPLALALWAALAVSAAFALRFLFRRSRGDVPRAVVTLIATIALYDAVLVAATGQTGLAIAAALCFPLTLALQKLVPGT